MRNFTALRARSLSAPYQVAAVIASLGAATVLITYPQAFQLSRSVGLNQDALFSVWRLAWVAHALNTQPTRLFDANIFYPHARTLAYSDALLLPAVVVAPLQWCHVPPVVVYNVTLLSAFFFSAFAMWCLVRSLTDTWFAGIIVAIAFAFSTHQLEHFERLEIQLAFWMPLTLWALQRTAASGRTQDGLMVGGLVAAQAYSGIYNGIFLLTYLGVVAPCLVLIGSSRKRATIVAMVAGLILAFGLTLPYLIPYLHNRILLGDRSVDEIRSYSATYADYLTVHPNNVLYGARLSTTGHAERFLFPGVIVIVLALLGIRPRARPISIVYLVGLMFAAEASRGLNSPIYTWLHDHIFLYRGLRVPARFGVLAQLSVAVLAGFGIERLCAAITRSWLRVVVLAALLIGVVVEYRANPPLQPVEPQSKIYAWLRRQPPAPVMELPVADPSRLYSSNDVTYMVNSSGHWYPLLNGYSGFYPDSYILLLEAMRSFPSRDSLHYLVKVGVTYMLVHERYMSREEYRSLTSRLAVAADVERLATYFEGDYEVAAYRLTPRPPADRVEKED
jgi:hypothetical protein